MNETHEHAEGARKPDRLMPDVAQRHGMNETRHRIDDGCRVISRLRNHDQ
jgi:hypothetical protein